MKSSSHKKINIHRFRHKGRQWAIAWSKHRSTVCVEHIWAASPDSWDAKRCVTDFVVSREVAKIAHDNGLRTGPLG